jgi:hypothetical protein
VIADNLAEQPAEELDVGVLVDLRGGHAASCTPAVAKSTRGR